MCIPVALVPAIKRDIKASKIIFVVKVILGMQFTVMAVVIIGMHFYVCNWHSVQSKLDALEFFKYAFVWRSIRPEVAAAALTSDLILTFK